MTQESSDPRATRRQILRYGGGIATATATALAGCSGIFSQSSSSPITNVTVRKGTMTMNFTANNGIDSVYLASNGSDSVTPVIEWKDNTTARIGLYTSSEHPFGGYVPLPEGNYTVGVRKGNKTVDTRRVTLTAQPTLTAIQPEPAQESDSDFSSTGNLFITLTNKGNLPTELSAIGMRGVPNPRRIREKPANELSPTRKALSRVWPDLGEGFGMMVFPSVETTFKTTWGPLQMSVKNYEKYTKDLDSDGYPDLPTPCRTKQWSATLTLRYAHSTLTRPFTYSFSGKAKQPFLSNKYLCTGISTSLTPASSGVNTTKGDSTQ